MLYWSNILRKKIFSDELIRYLTWTFGVKYQNLAIFDPFWATSASLIKKLIMHNDSIDKILYPVEWADLSSTSVVILTFLSGLIRSKKTFKMTNQKVVYSMFPTISSILKGEFTWFCHSICESYCQSEIGRFIKISSICCVMSRWKCWYCYWSSWTHDTYSNI